MKFLFFFVHPSKYHLYKITINKLISDGHEAKVLITSKDVLENLVREESWDYANIFPEGRKIKGLPSKTGAFINIFVTLYRLNKYASQSKYDLYITDDLLTILGRLRKVPSILFQDDDLSAVPESVILLASASYILAPECTNFSIFNRKKIGVKGFKASAYLHPNHFKPDEEVLKKYGLHNKRFFIIRLVSLKATHDVGKKGLSDEDLLEIIKIMEKSGEVIINSERYIPENLSRYRKNIQPSDLIHLMSFADLFISDSQTMSMEAGFLGTPYIRYNDFVGRITYLEALENKYGLGFGIRTNNKDKLFTMIKELTDKPGLKQEWKIRTQKMLNDTVDLTVFMTWLYENFPGSIKQFKACPDFKLSFR